MKYQRLLEPDRAPRDGYPFTDPDTKWTSYGKTPQALIDAATLHRTSNGLPVSADFALIVETQVCQMFPGRCVNRDGSPQDISCIHRGEETLRWEGCDTCGGVRAKIQPCALYAECSQFNKSLGEIKLCGLCPPRVSTLPEGEQ